jgi:hypothetical protein
MLNGPRILGTLTVFALTIVSPFSAWQQTSGVVCPNSDTACHSAYSFKPYQLPFLIREKLVFGKTYKSAPFYAVVLQSVRNSGSTDCQHIGEEQRLEAQALFQDRKVFASRFSCPEELVLYTSVNQEFNFLAVYGGATLAEAKQTLNKAKATGRYPEANIRKMQVVVEYST